MVTFPDLWSFPLKGTSLLVPFQETSLQSRPSSWSAPSSMALG